jgi:hypothetical protein
MTRPRRRWGTAIVEVDEERVWANTLHVTVVEAGVAENTTWGKGTTWWVARKDLYDLEETEPCQGRLI